MFLMSHLLQDFFIFSWVNNYIGAGFKNNFLFSCSTNSSRLKKLSFNHSENLKLEAFNIQNFIAFIDASPGTRYTTE